ncbi:MAG TPA: hypothetical protein VJC10_03180 [Patescibacteria group bacterium]|nr:hypothetical protein [Patescibacteria group bacterium]
MKKTDHERNVRSVLSFLLLLFAVSVFLLFYQNKDVVLTYGTIKPFLVLTIVLMGLLFSLMYLASNSLAHSKKRKK